MVSVDTQLREQATELLIRIQQGDATAVAPYDELLFRMLFDVATRRGRLMATDLAVSSGSSPVGFVQVRRADLESVAQDAVTRALRRARASALRFDPALGDGASWALGALGPAYLDAAREHARTRRAVVEIPTEDRWLEPEQTAPTRDPEHVAVLRDRLDRALALLDDDERYVLIARLHYYFSYREIALFRFGDEDTKRVDRLLQSARSKIRAFDERPERD